MPTIDININKRVFNDIYLPFLENEERYNVLCGGAGSGKSVFLTQRFTYRLLKNTKRKLLVVRKVGRTIRDSVWSEFKNTFDMWNLTDIIKCNVSTFTMIFPNGNEIIFKGLDDPEKIKSIQGVTDIWVEEATEINADDFQQLDIRLRGKAAVSKQLFLSLNPSDYNSWIKKRFFDAIHENSVVLKSTYKDNKFLDEEYKKVLEDLIKKDAVYYKVYTLGEWAPLGGLIFTNWQTKGISLSDNDYDSILLGGDWGFNHPSAFVKIGLKDDNLYIMDELYRRELTNNELMNEVEQLFGKGYRITADSAEPDRIKEFKQHGFKHCLP